MRSPLDLKLLKELYDVVDHEELHVLSSKTSCLVSGLIGYMEGGVSEFTLVLGFCLTPYAAIVQNVTMDQL